MDKLTIKEAHQFIRSEIGSYYPGREVEALSRIILADTTRLTRTELLYSADNYIDTSTIDKISKICDDLKRFKPIQYILGKTEFFGLELKVDASTLIPRQETEELIALIISEVKGNNLSILDIGTGSGAIAIALAKSLTGSRVTASDISSEALAIAADNASLNGCSVEFIEDDLHRSRLPDSQFDVIVSNPPYVTESEKTMMHANVVDYEPPGALFVPDDDPLVAYRSIAVLAQKALVYGGRLYLEINERFGREVSTLLEEHGFKNPLVIRDINNRDRFVKTARGGAL